MQDYSAHGHRLHAEFVANFRDRRGAEFASYFAPAGVFRLIDPADGLVLDEARGREGVLSLVRAIHENVEFIGFTTADLHWFAGVIAYGWTATLRNWGFGAPRPARGRVRLECAGASIRFADFFIDAQDYYALVRPDGLRRL